MDSQLKRGLLDACVLALLKKGDSYGYQLLKEAPSSMELTESTLYPVLRRLEGSGCLTVYSSEHAGRLRRYYQITEAGRRRIADFIAEWAAVKEVYMLIEEADRG